MKITDAAHDIETVLYTRQQIAQRVDELGAQLTRDYAGTRPVMVCLLKGASVFFTDLCRSMPCHVEMDFITVSSYGESAKSSGVIRLSKDISTDIAGRHVILVDDIMDSGLTLAYLKKLLELRQPLSVKICCMLDKKDRHDPAFTPDYCGFDCPDAFVVGYGLDYANYYRNLPYIGILKKEVYED